MDGWHAVCLTDKTHITGVQHTFTHKCLTTIRCVDAHKTHNTKDFIYICELTLRNTLLSHNPIKSYDNTFTACLTNMDWMR